MRTILCLALSLALFCLLVFGGSALPDAPLPPGRLTAWWGLLFPGLFSAPVPGQEGVTFVWPVLDSLLRLFA